MSNNGKAGNNEDQIVIEVISNQLEHFRNKTHVFATDSPYERQKASIGSVVTPMFEHGADYNHLEKLEKLIREWVEFVQEQADRQSDFQSFKVDP